MSSPRHIVRRSGNAYAIMELNCYTGAYEVLLDGLTESTANDILKRDFPQDAIDILS